MVSLGVKAKEAYGMAVSEKGGGENDKVYPEIHVSGKMAEIMGAPDLKAGDAVKVGVVMRVKKHSKTVENRKTNYSMDLCLEEMDDEMEQVDSEEEDAAEGDNEDVKNLRSSLGMDGMGEMD